MHEKRSRQRMRVDDGVVSSTREWLFFCLLSILEPSVLLVRDAHIEKRYDFFVNLVFCNRAHTALTNATSLLNF